MADDPPTPLPPSSSGLQDSDQVPIRLAQEDIIQIAMAVAGLIRPPPPPLPSVGEFFLGPLLT